MVTIPSYFVDLADESKISLIKKVKKEKGEKVEQPIETTGEENA